MVEANKALAAEHKRAEDTAKVLESHRKELSSIDAYQRDRAAPRADRVQACNLFTADQGTPQQESQNARRTTASGEPVVQNQNLSDMGNSRRPNPSQVVNPSRVINPERQIITGNGSRQSGESEAPPEDVYATLVQNLIAAAVLFEDVAIKGDRPQDLTLRRGLTLVQAARLL
jgi:hypothetical protein